MVTQPDIHPGDCLLYSGTSLWSRVIMIKTWSDISHSEVALNEHYAITSRTSHGVNLYTLTWDHLAHVLRPEGPIDFGKAMAWFKIVKGEKYGYWQALRFFRMGKENMTRMMCSPCCTRLYRAGGFHPFAGDYDASLVAPRDFLTSPHFTVVWSRDVESTH